MASLPSPSVELEPDRPNAEIRRGGPSARLAFAAPRRGETIVFAELSARSVDWGRPGAECAVLRVALDGKHASDVIVLSERGAMRGVSLGHLEEGRHTVTFSVSDRSPAGATSINVVDPLVVHANAGSAEEMVYRHAPVLYGRTLPELGGPQQNTVTDAPLVAWHRVTEKGTSRSIEYSVLWTHEDGGTDGPSLMAKWGRTTDIEWVYRVEVDARGDRLPGSAVIQGVEHATRPFGGAYERDHPLLQTCTDNNMVSDRVDGDLRFFLAADGTIDPGRSRESVMDAETWIYAAMAGELHRAGLVERWRGPDDPSLGDPRDYLYVELDARPAGVAPIAEPLFALGVRVAGDPMLYRSDRGAPERALPATGPRRAAIRLPPGTRAEHVVELRALRVDSDPRAEVLISDVMSAFFLDAAYRPHPVGARLPAPVRIGGFRRQAVLWSRLAEPRSDRSLEGGWV